jgi:hypothetical protein
MVYDHQFYDQNYFNCSTLVYCSCQLNSGPQCSLSCTRDDFTVMLSRAAKQAWLSLNCNGFISKTSRIEPKGCFLHCFDFSLEYSGIIGKSARKVPYGPINLIRLNQ